MKERTSIYAPVEDHFNRENFGKMIVGIRVLEDMTRAQLAAACGMGHAKLEDLEKGTATGSITHAARVQLWMEMRGYVFPSGTQRVHFDRHSSLHDFEWKCANFTIDLTMPAGMRRITHGELMI